MLRRVVSSLLIVLALLIAQTVAASENYVIAQAYFEDSTNHLTFDQIQSKDFVGYEKILARGYSHSTYWLKLRIKADSSDGSLVLRVRPAYTDEIELFDPLERRKDLKPRLTGDKHPWSSDEYQSLNLNFKLKKATGDRDIYLRVKSAHTYMLHAEALDLPSAEAADKKLELIYFSYLAFLIVLFVWLFIAWLLNRERVLGWFSLTQLVAIFYAASMFGFLRVIFDQLLSPDFLNQLTNYLITFYVVVALYSHMNLLAEYGLKPLFKWGLRLFVLLPIASSILIAFDYVTVGLKINAISLLWATTFIAITAYWGGNEEAMKPEKYVMPKVLVRTYYTLLLLILLMTLLPLMGVFKAVEFSLHALFIHGLLSGLMLFSLLQYRARRINQTQLERILHESSRAEQEKLRREDQGRLVGMLTHELKNSLAVVDLAVGLIATKLKGDPASVEKNLINISKAIDDINSVIARCIDVDKLDQDKLRVSIQSVNLVDFFKELSLELQGSNRLRWDCDVPVIVDLDPDLLKVIIVNLIDNATKYALADSLIDIKVIAGQQATSIMIGNQVGYSGFPDETKLFDKYYRSDKAQKDRGTGLGLWLSRSIARLMNAELSYQATGDQITFSIIWTHDEK